MAISLCCSGYFLLSGEEIKESYKKGHNADDCLLSMLFLFFLFLFFSSFSFLSMDLEEFQFLVSFFEI